ncbi:MAG: OadG family transporter subunit, partial [Hydrogeniiclostridium sp.]
MPMFLALQTDNPVTLSLTILLTGLVVVFLVLIVLTDIIKLYGTIVYNATNKAKKPVPEKKAEEPAAAAPVQASVPAAVEAVEEEIPGEIVAAIAAAVYCTEGAPVSAIKS